jgi:hypothetical protein
MAPMHRVPTSNTAIGVTTFVTVGPLAPPVNRIAVPAVPFTRRFWIVDDGSVAERAKREADAQMYHLIYRPMPSID